VPLHRALADRQRAGDLAIALARGDECQHLGLPRREPSRRDAMLRRAFQGLQVAGGSELRERGLGPSPFALGGFDVSHGIECPSQPHPRPGHVVASVERTPPAAGFTQCRQASLGFAGHEAGRTRCQPGRGDEPRGPERRGNLAKLAGCVGCSVRIASDIGHVDARS
jgi:hypothetical protein